MRKVGPLVGAVGGPARIDVDGFTCMRTRQDPAGPPSSELECTRGSKEVTFLCT